eukprot:846724-Prorocentrum_minimum.AAC.2
MFTRLVYICYPPVPGGARAVQVQGAARPGAQVRAAPLGPRISRLVRSDGAGIPGTHRDSSSRAPPNSLR